MLSWVPGDKSKKRREEMTEKDKKVICDYMFWPSDKVANLDLRDVGLCVDEMEEHEGDYFNFITFAVDLLNYESYRSIGLIVSNVDIFFPAMAAWLKSEKRV
jgi:hypothetical protein